MLTDEEFEQQNTICRFTMSLPESRIMACEVNDLEMIFDIPNGVGFKRVQVHERQFSKVTDGRFWPWVFRVVNHNEQTGILTCLMYLLLPEGEVAVSYD